MKYLLSIIIIFAVFVPGLAWGQGVDCKNANSSTKNLTVQDSIFLDELNNEIPIQIDFKWTDPRCYKERININVNILPAVKIVSQLTKSNLTSLPGYNYSTKLSPCSLVGDCETLKRLEGLTISYSVVGEDGNLVGENIIKKILLEEQNLYCAYKDSKDNTLCVQGSNNSQATSSCKNGQKCPQCDIQYPSACGTGASGKCFVTDVRQCGAAQGGYVCNNNKACVLKDSTDPNSYPANATTYNNIDSCAQKCEEYVCKTNEGCFRKSTVSASEVTNKNYKTYSNYDSCFTLCGGSNVGNEGGGLSTKPSEDISFSYKIPNLLAGKAENLGELIDYVLSAVLKFAIPIAVLFIIFQGVRLLLNPIMDSLNYKPVPEKEVLNNIGVILVALAIIFIGRGFVTLIISILNPPS